MKVKELKLTLDCCPTQYEGFTTDGNWIYVRYRWGVMTIDIWEKENFKGKLIKRFSKEIGPTLDGELPNPERIKSFIISFIENRMSNFWDELKKRIWKKKRESDGLDKKNLKE